MKTQSRSSRVSFSRAGFVVATFALAASTSWGAFSACSTSAQGTALTAYDGLGSGTGCTITDVSFQNFSLTNASNSGSGSIAQTAASDAFFATNPFSGQVFGTFDPSSAAPTNWDLTSHNNSEAATINYNVAASASAFNQVKLLASVPAVGSQSTITVIEDFCLNVTTTAGCTAANHGTITATYNGTTTVTYTCSFGGLGFGGATGCAASNSNVVNLSGAFLTLSSLIAISDQYSISINTGSTPVTMTNFQNQFFETGLTTPEPSSFVLLGSALVGLGVMRFRRKK